MAVFIAAHWLPVLCTAVAQYEMGAGDGSDPPGAASMPFKDTFTREEMAIVVRELGLDRSRPQDADELADTLCEWTSAALIESPDGERAVLVMASDEDRTRAVKIADRLVRKHIEWSGRRALDSLSASVEAAEGELKSRSEGMRSLAERRRSLESVLRDVGEDPDAPRKRIERLEGRIAAVDRDRARWDKEARTAAEEAIAIYSRHPGVLVRLPSMQAARLRAILARTGRDVGKSGGSAPDHGFVQSSVVRAMQRALDRWRTCSGMQKDLQRQLDAAAEELKALKAAGSDPASIRRQLEKMRKELSDSQAGMQELAEQARKAAMSRDAVASRMRKQRRTVRNAALLELPGSPQPTELVVHAFGVATLAILWATASLVSRWKLMAAAAVLQAGCAVGFLMTYPFLPAVIFLAAPPVAGLLAAALERRWGWTRGGAWQAVGACVVFSCGSIVAFFCLLYSLVAAVRGA